MLALRVSLGTADLGRRMQERLLGVADTDARSVVWQQGGSRVLVHSHTLTVRALDGWLICNLDLQTDESGRQTLQFIYFLGKEQDASPHGSATINAATHEAAQIADRWGRELQRILWDAILDGIEASVQAASIQISGRPVTLAGFFSTREALFVDVVAGDH